MSFADVSGAWEGSVHGTNQGRVYLKISQRQEDLDLELRINDYNLGTYSLSGRGRIRGQAFTANLSPRNLPPHLRLGKVITTATLDGNGELKGEWESEAGTAGAFTATRVPLQVGSSNQMAQPKTAFIMMKVAPTDAEAEDVHETIKRTCERNGITAVRADDVEHSGKITEVVLTLIREKDVLICDLTNERPNVYYELGFAHGMKRQVILVAKDGTNVHFDVKDYNVIFYRNMSALEGKLSSRLQSIMAVRPS